MRVKAESKATLLRILVMGIILIFCTSWFFFLYDIGRVEIVYSYLYYIPIVFGAYFYGIAGGFAVSAVAGLTYSLLVSASGISFDYKELFAGVASFLLIGLLTGLLSFRLKKKVKQVVELYMGSVKALAIAVDERDHYTQKHSANVKKYAAAIASELKLPREQIENIQGASELHDIGKIGVPDCVLNKEGKLTDEEWDLIKLHPSKAVKILEPLNFFHEITGIIRHHHERYDGRGYPDTVAKGNIPLGARIIAVADAFDAMTTDRPYRKALSTDAAIKELRSESGRQFDPEIVDTFLKVFEKGHNPD